MKPRKDSTLVKIALEEWSPNLKFHLHDWLFDAAVMLVGAWIFLAIVRAIVKLAGLRIAGWFQS